MHLGGAHAFPRSAVHNISSDILPSTCCAELPGDGNYTDDERPCDLLSARLEGDLDRVGTERKQGCWRQPLLSWGVVQPAGPGCPGHGSSLRALNQHAVVLCCLHSHVSYN